MLGCWLAVRMVVPTQEGVQLEISEGASLIALGLPWRGLQGIALLGISGRRVVRDLGVITNIFQRASDMFYGLHYRLQSQISSTLIAS